MNAADLLRAASLRFRRSSTWWVILAFGLIWVPARLLAGVPWDRIGAWEFVVPTLFLTGHLALSAVPWQWSGRSDTRPSLGRGFLQAVPWNAAWVLLLLWAVHDTVKPPRPPRNPPPREQEQPRPDADGGGPQAAPRRGNDPEDRPRREEVARPPREEGDRPRREERDRGEARRPREGEGRPAPQQGRRPEVVLLFLNLPFAMVLGWFLSEKERVEALETELRDREREARALALQSQLHPHVLFNILGGLTELVHEDPDAAEEALVGLTELLRMLLAHGSALQLPLGQERALLRRYLEIEAIRLGSRLEVQWMWQDELDMLPVPPLLLQPLVENAIKHGISPSPEGGQLRLDAVRTAQGILLRVANTGRPLATGRGEGIGLGNLRRRLALLPPPKPVLDLRQEGAWTVAELRLERTLGT